jgi:hypothetical protein
MVMRRRIALVVAILVVAGLAACAPRAAPEADQARATEPASTPSALAVKEYVIAEARAAAPNPIEYLQLLPAEVLERRRAWREKENAMPQLLQAVERYRLASMVLGATAFVARIAVHTFFMVSDGYDAANIIAQAFRGIAAYCESAACVGQAV